MQNQVMANNTRAAMTSRVKSNNRKKRAQILIHLKKMRKKRNCLKEREERKRTKRGRVERKVTKSLRNLNRT